MLPKRSLAWTTVEKMESRNRQNSVTRATQPTKPHSPNTARAKSEWRSGRKLSLFIMPSM